MTTTHEAAELKPCECGRMPKLERSDLSGGGLDSPRIRFVCTHATGWHYEEKYRDEIGGYDDIRAEAMVNAITEWNTSARTTTAAPTEDAVEALARAIYCLSPADEMPVGLIKEMAAKACLVRLSAQGYTLRRETMTEAELAREAEELAITSRFNGVTIDMVKAMFIDLAKKYRG